MKDTPSPLHSSERRAFWKLALSGVMGILVTLAAFWCLRKSELGAYQKQFERAVSSRAQLFVQRMDEDILALDSLGSFLDESGEENNARFNEFATKLLAERKETGAFAWAPCIRVESPSAQQYSEATPEEDSTAALTECLRFPILNIQPVKGNHSALGIDLAGNPMRRNAMERAIENGMGAFFAETEYADQLPFLRKTMGKGAFLLLVPVYRKGMSVETPSQRRVALEGFVVGAFHTNDLMRNSMWQAPSIGLSTEFIDLAAPFDQQMVFSIDGIYDNEWITLLATNRPEYLFKFQKAGQELGLHMTADNTYLKRFYPIGHLIVLPCGLLLTLLGSLYIHATLSHQAKKVHTARLAAANHDLATKVQEHRRWHKELRRQGDELEKLVSERTAQLLRKNADLAEEIAERKRMEEEMRRSRDEAEEANRAKDQFIAVLSHELRTPLTPVLAAITALKAQENLPTETRGVLGMMKRNVELEAKLIDDLLDVTRISQGKIELRCEAVDAHTLLNTALEIFQSEISEKGLTVALHLCAYEHVVWADPARLCQVFWNLLKNAVKFTPEKGRIDLRTFNANGRLRIEFADTGIGIEPEVMPRIFDAFEQGEQGVNRQFGGLGLGLSIAKAVVDMHQGNLTATSEGKDMGATFTVELDGIPVAAKVSTPFAPRTQGQSPKLKVLLVDDHDDTLQIISKLLRKWQYSVTTANSVRSALERAAVEKFDILVSDLGLPDGSGMDIMSELKKRHALRGIAISGYGSDEDIRRSQEAGFEAHIVKPVNFEYLRGTIQRIVRAKGSEVAMPPLISAQG